MLSTAVICTALFPYITLAWLIIGAAVVIFAPHLAKRMGDGLTRTLGIPELGGPHHQHDNAVADSDLAGSPGHAAQPG